jgi:hypothetical protein
MFNALVWVCLDVAVSEAESLCYPQTPASAQGLLAALESHGSRGCSREPVRIRSSGTARRKAMALAVAELASWAVVSICVSEKSGEAYCRHTRWVYIVSETIYL